MLGQLLRSFAIGFAGLVHVLRSEQNMRIHALAAIAVVVAGFLFRIEAWEWTAVLLCIGVVLAAECMNTAIERLADRVSLERHPLLKNAKDSAAAAVLVLAMTAAVVGGVVFVPRLRALAGL